MHELSLALDLVERALIIAQREKVQQVRGINVLIGPDSGVDPEAFAFAFPEAAHDTLLAKTELRIQRGTGREFQFQSMVVEDV
ncbi:MAG: hypothetical protein C5B49_04480 [Bdellovibrio sp.]|nr:MAG: hypothetical protein C5B49_04480 [Bdellovibrio sp.]